MACTRVSFVPENTTPLPDFTRWPSFPFEGDMRVKELADPVAVEPPRSGEDADSCVACRTTDDAYIWVNERWRVRAMDRPTGLPVVLILECRSHLDLGDLTSLLAAELGVMTVRLERAIRSLDGVARVHVNRWGDGSAHLHMWFLARPYGRLQLRGTFLSLWDDILPTISEPQWRENLALVAAWLADFGGQANAEPAHIQWQSPLSLPVEAAPPGGAEDTPTGADTGPQRYAAPQAQSGAAPASSGPGGSDQPDGPFPQGGAARAQYGPGAETASMSTTGNSDGNPDPRADPDAHPATDAAERPRPDTHFGHHDAAGPMTSETRSRRPSSLSDMPDEAPPRAAVFRQQER